VIAILSQCDCRKKLQKQHVTAIAKKGKSAIAKKLVQKSFMP
jgi:hypothetical protein